jgi:regulator of sigma E protease
VRERAGTDVVLSVRRNGELIEVTVVPRVLTPEQEANGEGPIGFGWQPERMADGSPMAEGPLEALGFSLAETGRIAVSIPGGLARAIGGLLGLAPDAGDVRGPIGIAQLTGEVMGMTLATQLGFVALLSLNLAVLNILPLPPLDGGRIVVSFIEGLQRRRLPEGRAALIFATGFVVLLALVILISIRDIQQL